MALNCDDIESIEIGCESAIGGINQKIYINDSENLDFDSFVLDEATHTYTTLALRGGSPPGVPFETIDFRKNIASLTEDYTQDNEGAVIFTQTLTLGIHGRDAGKSKKISTIAAGQRDVDIIIVQNDGGLVYLRKAQLATVADGTMATKSEASKYTLTFRAEQEQLAYFVAPDALVDVL